MNIGNFVGISKNKDKKIQGYLFYYKKKFYIITNFEQAENEKCTDFIVNGEEVYEDSLQALVNCNIT